MARKLSERASQYKPGEALIHLKGPLDRWGTIRLRFKLLFKLARGCQRLVLDMKRVPFVDSDGVRLLRWLVEDFDNLALEVVNANSRVLRTLEWSRMENLVKRPAETESVAAAARRAS